MSVKLTNLTCPNLVVHRRTRKKGILKADKRAHVWGWWARKTGHNVPREHVRCNGNLTMIVEAQEDPYWGGTVAKLNFEVRCDRCGTAYLMDLDTTGKQCVQPSVESLVAEALDSNPERFK